MIKTATRTRLELLDTPIGIPCAWRHVEADTVIPKFIVRDKKLYEIKTMDGSSVAYWPVEEEDIQFWNKGEPTR